MCDSSQEDALKNSSENDDQAFGTVPAPVATILFITNTDSESKERQQTQLDASS